MFAALIEAAGAAGEAVAHEASKGGGAGLPQMDATYFPTQLFWLGLTFLGLWFVLSKIALPRVGEVITERRDRIARDIDAAARLKGDTDQALAGYEKALADARAKASGMAKDTRAALAKETDAEKVRVEGQINAKIAQAEARIADTKKKALTAVSEIAADTAAAVVAKLIGQNVDAADVKKAMSQGAGPGAGE